MIVKTIDMENFNHFKLPSMVVGFPYCTFKCDEECGGQVCQNSTLAKSQNIDISYSDIVEKYMNNKITEAIVFAGLEPMDSFNDVFLLLSEIRKRTSDIVVIFTGYYKDEIKHYIDIIMLCFKNIIVKYGRYIPYEESHYDEVLGIDLASFNQYAERIS